jgi:SNF2 family DNA or RNA helicase
MNNMTKVTLSEINDDYVIQYDESAGNRKLMKTSIFLDGIQGVSYARNDGTFIVSVDGLDEYAVGTVLDNILHFLESADVDILLDKNVESVLASKASFDEESEKTLNRLVQAKVTEIEDDSSFQSFCSFCDKTLKITLRDYQYKSAYLLSIGKGGFDFSVPGAGKTIITYAAYAYLKAKNIVDKILVIGPSNAFNAWYEEYETCFGEMPDFTNLSFESTKNCKIYLNASGKNHTEISFINYDKVRLTGESLSNFLCSNKALLIIDEAHKVKNPNAAVTQAICEVTKYASSRIILTGTPMPNGYEDLSSLFYIFSPFKDIIPYRYDQLKRFTQKGATEKDITRIKDSINPFYSRISKKYLVERGELQNPVFKIVKCKMDENQIDLYEKLNSFVGKLKDDVDEDLLAYLKKAMLIRKMQISANPALLKKSIVSSMDELKEEYAQYSGADNSDINQLILADKKITAEFAASEIVRMISAYEQGLVQTNKNLTAVKIAEELLNAGKQVLIWDIFVANMNVLRDLLISQLRVNVEIINGSVSGQDRQDAIARFRKGSSKILLANPSTLAESISLHKVCQNAIYVNRNFNAAQFIQSKDRIHRINMPEGTTATYYFIENEDSVDVAIHERLELKENRMLAILDADDIEIGGSELEDGSIMSTEDIDLSYMR